MLTFGTSKTQMSTVALFFLAYNCMHTFECCIILILIVRTLRAEIPLTVTFRQSIECRQCHLSPSCRHIHMETLYQTASQSFPTNANMGTDNQQSSAGFIFVCVLSWPKTPSQGPFSDVVCVHYNYQNVETTLMLGLSSILSNLSIWATSFLHWS